jgi:hypothetical protein
MGYIREALMYDPGRPLSYFNCCKFVFVGECDPQLYSSVGIGQERKK